MFNLHALNMEPRKRNSKETRLLVDKRKLINGLIRSLIKNHYGSYDAAAAQINAENGTELCKGTISKRLSGQQTWPLEDIEALEDGVQVFPVTRRMAARLEAASGADSDILSAVMVAAKEFGEAVTAALAAQQSGDHAAALKETQEAEYAARSLRESIEANTIPLRGVVT